jgi:antitoxin (DNA-binding transcriptional repressor) of toxin-antitoxin stability system
MVVVGVLVVAVAGGAYLLANRDDGSTQRAAVDDPLAEALAFAPAAAPVVVQFDVQRGSQQGNALRDLARTFPAARFAADGVRQSVRALGLDADADLPSLLGGPVVVAGPAQAAKGLQASIASLQLDLPAIVRAGATAAVVGRSADDVDAVLRRAAADGRLRKLANNDPAPGVDGYALPDDAAVLGQRDGDLVLGADSAAVRRAFAIKDAKGGLTRATFDERLGPLAHVPALIRGTAQARALISAKAQGVPWVDALRAGALAVAIEKPGIHLRIHLATDPAKLQPTDLPIAPGAQSPQPAPGQRPIDLALRDPAQTLRTLDAAKDQLDLPFLDPIKNALATLDSVKGPLKTFGRIDVDDIIGQLTGTMTVTPEATRNTIAVRAEMTDGDDLRAALNRLAAIPDLALEVAGVDLNVDRDGEAYTITDQGKGIAKLAVLDRTLVVTNDLTASLKAIADRRPKAAPAQGTGALSLHLDGLALQDQLVTRLHLPDLARLVLGGFGDVDGTARAERGGVDLDATLTLND